MSEALYCNRCRVRLTAPLTLLPPDDARLAWPGLTDMQDIVARGLAYRSEQAVPWMGKYDGALAFAPQYWLNPDDLTDMVRDTDDSSRLLGCCSTAGYHGPNQVCRCNAEVGTLHQDCMGPRFFIPEPSATTMRAATGDYWNYT